MTVITGYDIPKLNYCRHRHKTILNESVCTQRAFCNPHQVFQIDDCTTVLYGQTLQHWNWFRKRHWVPISVGDDGLNWLLHGIKLFFFCKDFVLQRLRIYAEVHLRATYERQNLYLYPCHKRKHIKCICYSRLGENVNLKCNTYSEIPPIQTFLV